MWCLDSIALSIGNLSPDQSFWIILEYHSEEPRSSESSADSGASIIGQLIECLQPEKISDRSRADPLRAARFDSLNFERHDDPDSNASYVVVSDGHDHSVARHGLHHDVAVGNAA